MVWCLLMFSFGIAPFLDGLRHNFPTQKNLLPPSHFVCPLFLFGMSQNIVLFLKIKVINLLMFLLYLILLIIQIFNKFI